MPIVLKTIYLVVNADDNYRPFVNPNDGKPMQWESKSGDDAQRFADQQWELSGERWLVAEIGVPDLSQPKTTKRRPGKISYSRRWGNRV